ncbi:MAG: hypothetical protein K0S24_3987 [Sphingobacterium sp.]|jgi:hypothetical protein|nr:hypothetical protein [Sphingobacterium sp.]
MNKGGRPRKIDTATLKKIAIDYYIREKDCNSDCLCKKGIYSSLAEYANRQGHNCAPTDFSRCKELREWLTAQVEVAAQKAETDEISQTGFVPIDMDYLSRLDFTVEKQKKYLLERDAYYQSVQTKAAKAVEAYVQLQQQNDELRKRVLQESRTRESQEEASADMIQENRALKKENAYYRTYIKENINPKMAETVLAGNGISTAFTNKEPAMITMSEFIGQDVAENKNIDFLTKIGAIVYGQKKV